MSPVAVYQGTHMAPEFIQHAGTDQGADGLRLGPIKADQEVSSKNLTTTDSQRHSSTIQSARPEDTLCLKLGWA